MKHGAQNAKLQAGSAYRSSGKAFRRSVKGGRHAADRQGGKGNDDGLRADAFDRRNECRGRRDGAGAAGGTGAATAMRLLRLLGMMRMIRVACIGGKLMRGMPVITMMCSVRHRMMIMGVG